MLATDKMMFYHSVGGEGCLASLLGTSEQTGSILKLIIEIK